MKKFVPKIMLVLIILTLGGFILIFSVKNSPQFGNQKQINQKVNIPSEQECNTAYWFRTQKEPYCMDINFCPEPCWSELRAEIEYCLQLKREIVTPEKIEGYLKKYPPPSFFEESRSLCKSWAKSEQQLKDCLRGYQQICSQ